MGDLINLKQVRKRIARDEAAKQSEINRARFGRTKGERNRDALQARRANDALDQHRIDDGTPA
ncbi:MAG: DUF4169 family protein [Afipia sp.]|jgi:hypothetical protein|nr:DUF4169 family protein [Afipia sp.]